MKNVFVAGGVPLRLDLEILDQSGSGRGVKFYAPPLVWLTFYYQNNTTCIGMCTKQITCTYNYVLATATVRLQVR